jgi:hypothetical protein
MFRRVAGRPVLPCVDLAAWRRRAMSWCQRRIVSGATSSHIPWRPRFGYHAEQGREQGPVRPVQVRATRLPPLQDRSWWRRIKISAVFHVSSRWDRRSHEATRVIRRKVNRRHMIGDHHGRTAGRATLLVRAMDGILGTHRLQGLILRAKGRAGGLGGTSDSYATP